MQVSLTCEWMFQMPPGGTVPQSRTACHVPMMAGIKGSGAESKAADTTVRQAHTKVVKDSWRNIPVNCPTN